MPIPILGNDWRIFFPYYMEILHGSRTVTVFKITIYE